MDSNKLGLIMVLFCAHGIANAQAVDNTASFRMINADRYVRLHYENDFFTGHDLYYTQGINLEFVNPHYKKFILSKILLAPANTITNYGISLEHNGYTPSSITHDNILYGDRPFAADLFLKTFSFSANAAHSYRITSSFSIGIIGSIASGYWMQKTIHRWLHGTTPHGWENQIRNDVIINYEAGIEKNIYHAGNYLVINGLVNGRLGTLNDKVTAGFVLMVGKLNRAISSVFAGTSNDQTDKFTFHLYFQPLVNAVGYDATLQGVAFDRKSPYTISFRDVEHVTIQAHYGLVLMYHSIYLEYFKSAISKEFITAINHRWGGLRLGVKI
jgi:lipid A 3-O-deacylase